MPDSQGICALSAAAHEQGSQLPECNMRGTEKFRRLSSDGKRRSGQESRFRQDCAIPGKSPRWKPGVAPLTDNSGVGRRTTKARAVHRALLTTGIGDRHYGMEKCSAMNAGSCRAPTPCQSRRYLNTWCDTDGCFHSFDGGRDRRILDQGHFRRGDLISRFAYLFCHGDPRHVDRSLLHRARARWTNLIIGLITGTYVQNTSESRDKHERCRESKTLPCLRNLTIYQCDRRIGRCYRKPSLTVREGRWFKAGHSLDCDFRRFCSAHLPLRFSLRSQHRPRSGKRRRAGKRLR